MGICCCATVVVLQNLCVNESIQINASLGHLLYILFFSLENYSVVGCMIGVSKTELQDLFQLRQNRNFNPVVNELPQQKLL